MTQLNEQEMKLVELVSELSETIRIWLVTPVNGVKLDKTEFSV